MKSSLTSRNVLAVLLLAALVSAAAGASSLPGIVLVNRANSTLTLITPGQGAELKTFDPDCVVGEVLTSEDGRRLLVVLSAGGKSKPCGSPSNAGTQLVLLDTASLAPNSRVDLGRVASSSSYDRQFALSPDGNYLVAVLLVRPIDKPKEPQKRALITADLQARRVSVIEPYLDALPSQLFVSDSQTAVAVFEPVKQRKAATIPGEIRLIDRATGQVAAAFKFRDAKPKLSLSADRKVLYVIETFPSEKNPKAWSEAVFAISLDQRTIVEGLGEGLATIDFAPAPEGDDTLILGNRTPTPPGEPARGELRILRGTEIAGRIPVALRPAFVRSGPSGRQWWIVGGAGVTRINLETQKPEAEIPFEGSGVSEMVSSPDGTRAFLLFGEAGQVSTLDLEAGKVLAKVGTGKGTTKFYRGLQEARAQQYEYEANMNFRLLPTFDRMAANIARAGITWKRDAAIALGPGGKTVYVLNAYTDDVTAIEAKSGAVQTKTSTCTQAQSLRLIGNRLFVFTDACVDVFDLGATPPVSAPLLKGLRYLGLSDDGRHAVGIGKDRITVLDLDSGALAVEIPVNGRLKERLAKFFAAGGDTLLVTISEEKEGPEANQ